MNTNRPSSLPPHGSGRPRLVLATFVVLVFCTGTAEYLVAGVLPQLARDFAVPVATAGQAVTAYALGVAIGGPVVTVLTARLPRKGLALWLTVLFVAGIALTALAPTFAWLIVGRVLSACSQATLFAIALTTAVGALGHDKAGRAVAIVSSGLTVATVLGVPLGALLGGDTSWRRPFVVIAALAVVGLVSLAFTMPRTARPTTGVGDEVRALTRRAVLIAVATTVVGFAGVGIVFTYLVPLLRSVSGLSASYVPLLLLAYGFGGFIGNLAAGRLADLSLGRTLTGVFLLLAITLALFPVMAEYHAPVTVLVMTLGLVSTATIAPLGSLVLRHASNAPTLALAVNVGAFNLANAIGSALGGIGVAAGLMRANGYGGAVLALAGLGLSVLALRQPPPGPSSQRVQEHREDAGSHA
ncbi:MFS transporter [Nocardioides luteus]|uniref:MFS transporter n=1 Tax=Nocardioides luteus TaxID=1844 RepID=UPI001A2C9DDC|nr:MFS transporter [Nocardioides luteus]MBG6099254.1 DHA1 family inner membrane transport protein [Nocardioides luteus]